MMEKLLIVAGIGFLAQLIDGALGMSYGVTTTTLLVSAGTAPAVASATAHLAEVGTTLVSGVAHTRFGNVDWRIVATLAVPGGIAAFAGATFLSSLDAAAAEPFMAGFLLLLGCYILVKFAGNLRPVKPGDHPLKRRLLVPLGGVAGFLDAAGGGGWGPIGTTSLLASGRVEPRKAIGSIDTSEFIVAVCASAGFLAGLGSEAIGWRTVGALLVAGVIAAPIAAFVVRHMDPRLLGVGVGGILLVSNTSTLLGAVDEPPAVSQLAWSAVVAAILLGVLVTVTRVRRAGGLRRGGQPEAEPA
jgi:uncharacterized membrane protein YfcA